MQVAEELSRHGVVGGSVLTIGTFDGVHLGHQHLTQRVKEEARRRGLLSALVTFDKIPRTVINPDMRVPYLTNLEQRLGLMSSLGVDRVVLLTFDKEFSQLSAQEFMTLLVRHLGMAHLITGPDFRSGRDREGTSEVLIRLGEELGYTLEVVEPLVQDREIVSSTAIRKALAEGALERAELYLGRPYSLSGRVIPGHKRGKSLGFPTANLDVGADRALPADGVYVTWTHLGEECLPSVTNIGDNPTFRDAQRSVEVHILDFTRDIYGQQLRIDIVQPLRAEVRFASPEALVSQMHQDVEAARAILVASSAE